ncbi:MAG: FG-GAP-like repeat-containing protein, partial [Ignavibacteria bacterium]
RSSSAQNFTKITTGSIVNDIGDSWGCSWTDFNNDGRQDLFVTNVGNDFLYTGTGDSIFVRVTTGQAVSDGVDSRGSCWGDYDNDGDEDLFVSTGSGNNLLYRNDGNGVLTKITTGVIVTDGGTSRGCSWGDYDNDGRLDLYVANIGNDFLYHNNGAGNFTKIVSGDIVSSGGSTIGCNWVDYNNDGYLDLYANNFGGSAFLFKNNGDGTFTKIISGAIVTDASSATAGGWGDFDNDGDLDVVVANISNQGTYFYRNDGAPDYTFTKDTSTVIAHSAAESYAVCWVDHDNDGDLDLFIANVGNEFLFNNSGYPSYTFTRVMTGGIVNDGGSSYGSGWADYDNDGDVDVLICNKFGGKNSLFENNGNSNSWLNVKCIGGTANKSGIASRVEVKANVNGVSQWQIHEVTDQSSYYSSNSLNAEFGFGDASIIDSLVIKWPGGQTEVYTNLPVNKFYTVTQGQGIVGIKKNEIAVSGYSLQQNYPNPFNPETNITFTLPKKVKVSLTIYNIIGKKIATPVDGELNSGNYTVKFEAGDVKNISSGVYYYTLITPDFIETKKMILLK